MGFIPIDQMSKLREAVKGGDLRAKDILNKYLNRGDYASDLEAYFKPVETPTPASAPSKVIEEQGNPGSVVEAKATKGTGNAKLDQFLFDNGISEGDPDYDEAVEDYYNEFPNERPEPTEEETKEPTDEEVDEEVNEEAKETTKSLGQILIDVISECDKQMLEIMQNASVDENAKKGAMTSLQEIKQNTIDNIEKVKKIQKSFDKKEEAPLQ